MKKELYAGIEQMSGSGESLENIFVMMYITAGYPPHAYEDDFCLWMNVHEPSNDEIVEYFLKGK